MSDKKILIIGGDSYVGGHLFNALDKNKVIRTYFLKPIENGIFFDALNMKLSDVLDLSQISHAVILLGDTQPDSCAENIERSNKLNVESIKSVINELNKFNVKPVFTSSEFVFDGEKGNYAEEDPINPILVYGKQKVEIEDYIKENCSDYIIVRLSKVLGTEKNDKIFGKWLEMINNNQQIKCARDQIFTPVYVKDVADSIRLLIEKNQKGIFHIASSKAYSRVELLKMLLNHLKEYSSVKVNYAQCSIHDFQLKEKRPANVSMVSSKLVKATGIKLHDVNEICKEIVKDYYSKSTSQEDFFKSNDIWQDKNARTRSFFLTKDIVSISRNIIKQLVEQSKSNGNCDVRLSLHKDPSEDFHNMIILQNKGNYYRPHKHVKKVEAYQIVEGKMAIFIFNDNGSVKDAKILSPEEIFIYRIPKNSWHVSIPLTDYVIFNESKPGPFIREGDSIFAAWAPDGSNADEGKKYFESLLKNIK